MSRADRVDELWVCHLGLIPYSDALAIQGQLRDRRQAGELPDTLLLLEHPPVYTRGRRSRPEELGAHSPTPPSGLCAPWVGEGFHHAQGIEVVTTDRGGRVTYHGPGQLVGYPIMAVTDVVAHLRTIEDAIVAALADEGIAAHSRPRDGSDYTGVWVGERKLASLGVHVSRGISTHGFAVNIDNDLEPFDWVVACGLPDVRMTSIARELQNPGGAVAGPAEPGCDRQRLACFRKRIAHRFCEVHGRRQRLVSPRRMGIEAPVAAPSAPTRGTMPRAHHHVAPQRHADDPYPNPPVPA
jgi:lipoyl(octanoyl) transferase